MAAKKKLVPRIMVWVFAASALVYIGVQVISVFNRNMKCEQVIEDTIYDFVRTEGIVFREEQLVPSTATGIVVYNYSDGAEVAKGTSLAQVYQSEEQAQQQSEIESLREEISSLERVAEGGAVGVTGVSSITDQINEAMGMMVDTAHSGIIPTIQTQKNDLTVLMTKKKIALRQEDTVSGRLTELRQELAYLEEASQAQQGASIKSPCAGYFYRKIDGAETVCTTEALETLTYDRFTQLMETQVASEEESAQISKNYLGKVVQDHRWYFAADLTAKESEKFVLGEYVKLDFGLAGGQTIQAKVMDLIPDTLHENYVLVLECKDVTDQLLGLRHQQVEIIFNNYSGLRVSSQALRYEQNVPGVYVLDRTTIRFKPVDIIKESGSFLLCEPDPSTDSDHTLRVLDSVIVQSGGVQLKDGAHLREEKIEGVESDNATS